MNSFKKVVFAVTMAIAGFSGAAHASLINDSITLTGKLTGNNVTSQNAVITNAIEFSNIASYLNFDFSGTQLTVTVNDNIPDDFSFSNNLGTFVFSNFDDKISNFVINSNAPKFNNFGATDFSFNDHSISLNFAGVEPQNRNARLIFDITADPAVPGAAVPEPATVALLGLGLLGVAASRRKFGKVGEAE